MSTSVTPVPWQVGQRPRSTLNEKWAGVIFRALASGVAAKRLRISS